MNEKTRAARPYFHGKPVRRIAGRDDDFQCEEAKPFFFSGSRRTGILMLHGFTGSVSHMRPLGEVLRNKGYTVMGINIPGHADSLEALEANGQDAWKKACEEAAKRLRASCDLVIACGVSMGGVLSMILAEEKLVDGVISISAPYGVKQPVMKFGRAISGIKPLIYWRENAERAQQMMQGYDRGYAGFPAKSASELYDLIQEMVRNLDRVACRVYLIQSKTDDTIPLDSMEKFAGRLQRTRTAQLEDAPHMCTISRRHFEQVAALVLEGAAWVEGTDPGDQ
ncbi:MAG: alpha/beta fold hydrolase [Clostridia bacterium]|nr:alpha/beta fold hydrolase [Clostridia bacterium]